MYIGMLDVAVGSLCNQAQNYFVSGKTPMRAGNRHPNIQPQDVFPCADGHVVIVVGNDGHYATFCDAIGRPELIEAPRFLPNGDRVRTPDTPMPPLIAPLSA